MSRSLNTIEKVGMVPSPDDRLFSASVRATYEVSSPPDSRQPIGTAARVCNSIDESIKSRTSDTARSNDGAPPSAGGAESRRLQNGRQSGGPIWWVVRSTWNTVAAGTSRTSEKNV